MNLQELKEEVDAAIERAIEDGNSPSDIIVSVQIDGLHGDTPDEGSSWSSNVELHYDDNLNASGCVLLGWAEDK